VLPIVPGYLSLVTGLTIGELERPTPDASRGSPSTPGSSCSASRSFSWLSSTTWSVSDVVFRNQETSRVSGALVLLWRCTAGSQLLTT
jgi:hypothetical protein